MWSHINKLKVPGLPPGIPGSGSHVPPVTPGILPGCASSSFLYFALSVVPVLTHLLFPNPKPSLGRSLAYLFSKNPEIVLIFYDVPVVQPYLTLWSTLGHFPLHLS